VSKPQSSADRSFPAAREPVDLLLARKRVGAVGPQVVDRVLDRRALRREVERRFGKPQDFSSLGGKPAHPKRIIAAGNCRRMPEFQDEQSVGSDCRWTEWNVCLIAAVVWTWPMASNKHSTLSNGLDPTSSSRMSCFSKRTAEAPRAPSGRRRRACRRRCRSDDLVTELRQLDRMAAVPQAISRMRCGGRRDRCSRPCR